MPQFLAQRLLKRSHLRQSAATRPRMQPNCSQSRYHRATHWRASGCL